MIMIIVIFEIVKSLSYSSLICIMCDNNVEFIYKIIWIKLTGLVAASL